jgi:hypothetical protein
LESVKKGVRKGTEREAELSLRLLSILSITLGSGSEEYLKELFSFLDSLIKDNTRLAELRAAVRLQHD